LGLGLAPVGAYLAVTGYFSLLPVMMGVSVLLWVAGFDIIYALQDADFDRDRQLHSIPVWLGIRKSMRLSELLHVISGLTLAVTLYFLSVQTQNLGLLAWSGLALFLLLLVYQHTIIGETDLSRVNRAFFTTNGFASVFFGLALISDLLS
jgi:4-hydroxybenzoate polyprenyltransferase